MKQFYRNTTAIHILGWAIFILVPFLLSPGPAVRHLTEPEMLASSAVRNISLMALFYFNLLYLTPTFLKKNNAGALILILLAIVVVIGMTNWWVHDSLTGDFNFRHDRMPPPDDFGPGFDRPRPLLPGPVITSFLTTVIVAITSTTLVMWNNWTSTREQEQERTLQKVASELAVLKLQISPHFLFNTLNNIRWLVRSKSDQAEAAVMKLSQLLRYILYQTNADKVSLRKEIEHLNDFVSLQQLRLANDQSITFSVKVDRDDYQIVPLLFIPIIENFFKYGDFTISYDNKIDLQVNNGVLRFKTENAILKLAEEKANGESGIGLTNVKKRLALHYPDKGALKYSEKDGVFKLELELILT